MGDYYSKVPKIFKRETHLIQLNMLEYLKKLITLKSLALSNLDLFYLSIFLVKHA